MSFNNSAVQAMLSSGADAQQNMFDIWVVFPWSNNEEVAISTRAQNFQIKEVSVGMDDRKYHGSSIKVPKSSIEFERTFSLEFRLDASYSLFQQFITWHQTVADPVNGGVANWANSTGKVIVRALTGTYAATSVGTYIDTKSTYAIANSDDNAQWTFYDVWVSKVTQPNFNGEDGGALKYTVDFAFGDCDYPFYAGSGIAGRKEGGFTPSSDSGTTTSS